MDKASVPGNVRDAEIERMMREYGTSVLRMCYAYLRDPSLAEDAGQDTFIKAYRHLDSLLTGGKGHEKAWLMRIAINTCKDYRRSAWFRHLDLRTPIEGLPEASQPMAEKDQRLADGIIGLPRKEKEAVLLFYYQDMSYDEIAEALGISRSSVYNRLTRAKRLLKNTLEGWDLDGA